MLIDRFFDKLYINLPYVDEQSFRIKVASIIDSADSTSQKIKLSSIGSQYCEEFLMICLLLIIIRLAWLTLPSKLTNDLTDEEVILMKPENLVTMVLVDMVKEIFSSAKILGKPSLIIFQVALYLKFYNVLSPEDGFDLDDSFTNTNTSLLNSNDLSGDLTNETPNMNSPNYMATLVQMARTIGLNRDPLNFKNFYSATDDSIANARLFRKRHLWRKLWYGLLALSIESNLSLGDYKKGLPIEVDLDPTLGSVNKTWDCRLPGGVEQGVLEKSFRGCLLSREQVVVTNFRNSIVVHHLLYKGMSALFAIDDPPTSKDMDQIMNKLLDLISDRSRIGLNTAFFLSPSGNANGNAKSKAFKGDPKFEIMVKIYKFRLYLIVKSLLFSLNYLLFLNHEQKFNRLIAEKTSTLAKIEKQKEHINNYFEGSLLLAIDNYNVFVQVFGSADKLFPNSGAELVLYPYLMILNHRSHEFLISLVLRLQQQSPIVMEILNKNNINKDELLKRLFHYLNTFQEKLESLTKYYYYAWRLKKLVRFFYNILTNSSKLFSLNFKTMNVGIKDENQNGAILDSTPPPQQLQQQSQSQSQSQTANTNMLSRNTPDQGGNAQLRSFAGSPLQQQFTQPQQQDQETHVKKEPINAFEIAFGTSRLPPVTDFTTNGDLLSPHLQHAEQVGMNLYSELSGPSTSTSTGARQMMGSTGAAGDGATLNDIFDDHFFNDLTELNMSNTPTDSLSGLPQYGSNLQTAVGGPGSNSNPHQQANGNSSNGAAYSGFNDMMGVNGNSVTGVGFDVGVGGSGLNGFNGGVFNSLNEIDFTNVDLGNTPDSVGNGGVDQHHGQHGLGGLNFHF
ncbi:unnamed protein product [Ambrosiozyma monospora]|uniref:Unnamed protein product n=1 Tax=Ambrosiozyma monospora TaxID=43982 RepID=A0A9W6YW78_AMBMO|nr:unnamed protein product [Ambrosiozyma monospora]